MKDQERLFLAIGGADPAMVARSERRRGSRRSLSRVGTDIEFCLSLENMAGCHTPGQPGANYHCTRSARGPKTRPGGIPGSAPSASWQ